MRWPNDQLTWINRSDVFSVGRSEPASARHIVREPSHRHIKKEEEDRGRRGGGNKKREPAHLNGVGVSSSQITTTRTGVKCRQQRKRPVNRRGGYKSRRKRENLIPISEVDHDRPFSTGKCCVPVCSGRGRRGRRRRRRIASKLAGVVSFSEMKKKERGRESTNTRGI